MLRSPSLITTKGWPKPVQNMHSIFGEAFHFKFVPLNKAYKLLLRNYIIAFEYK